MNTESSEKKLIILHTITAVVISIDVFPDLYTYVILGATIVVLMDVLSFSLSLSVIVVFSIQQTSKAIFKIQKGNKKRNVLSGEKVVWKVA